MLGASVRWSVRGSQNSFARGLPTTGAVWRNDQRHAASHKGLEGKKKKQIEAAIPSSAEEVDNLLARSKAIEDRAHLQSNAGFTGLARSGLWSGAQVGAAVFCSAQAIDAFWSASLSDYWSEPLSLHLMAVLSTTVVATVIGTVREAAQETGRRLVEGKVLHISIDSMLQSAPTTWSVDNLMSNVRGTQQESMSWTDHDAVKNVVANSLTSESPQKPLPMPIRFLQGRLISILLPNVYFVIKGVIDEFPQQQYDSLSTMEKSQLIRRVAVGVGNGVILGQVDNVDSLGLLLAWGFAGLLVACIAVRQYMKHRARAKYDAMKRYLTLRSNGEPRYLVAAWGGVASYKSNLQEKMSTWKSKRDSKSIEGDGASSDNPSQPGLYQRTREKVTSLRSQPKEKEICPDDESTPPVQPNRVREKLEAIKSVRVIPEKWSRRKDSEPDQVAE